MTADLSIHGFHAHADEVRRRCPSTARTRSAIQDLVRAEPALGEPLHPALPYCGAEVVWAARDEMARTVEDVLARRTRALFLNAARRDRDGAARGRADGARARARRGVAATPGRGVPGLAEGYLVAPEGTP